MSANGTTLRLNLETTLLLVSSTKKYGVAKLYIGMLSCTASFVEKTLTTFLGDGLLKLPEMQKLSRKESVVQFEQNPAGFVTKI